MNKEKSPNLQLYTPWESFWLKFGAHKTPATLKLADEFVELLLPNEIELEVGSASGRVSNYLAEKRNVNVVGVDINSVEIKYAMEARRKSGSSKVEFAVMDGTQLDFFDNSFDTVVMVGVIGGVELEVRRKLIAEAFRVAKPGGKVAVSEFKINLKDPERRKKYERDVDITREWGTRIIRKGNEILFIGKHFNKYELRGMLKEAGFESIQIVEHAVESVGPGDGKREVRQQYTAWGIKPLEP